MTVFFVVITVVSAIAFAAIPLMVLAALIAHLKYGRR